MTFFVLPTPRVHEGQESLVTDYEPLNPVHHGNAPKCAKCRSFLGQMPWVGPRSAELEVWGHMYGDVVFGPFAELLVSERFLRAFQDAGLTGFDDQGRVDILRVKRHLGTEPSGSSPAYHCVLPRLGKTKINAIASGLVTKRPVTCDTCLSGVIVRYDRVAIDHSTWDGSDVFFALGLPGLCVVSDRFADWLEGANMSVPSLVPAEAYSENFGSTD